MTQDDQEEKARAAVASAIKHSLDNWAFQLHIFAFKAKTARARYLAARVEGFTVDEALRLCVEDVKL